MPCRSSTSTSSTRRPSVARVSARAAATVVFPVPPLPVTTCSRARWQALVHGSRAGPELPARPLPDAAPFAVAPVFVLIGWLGVVSGTASGVVARGSAGVIVVSLCPDRVVGNGEGGHDGWSGTAGGRIPGCRTAVIAGADGETDGCALLQGSTDGAAAVDGAPDDGLHPTPVLDAQAGQVDHQFLVQRGVAHLGGVGRARHVHADRDVVSQPRASEASALMPLQPASAIFINSPGVKTAPASAGPTST